VKASLKPEFIDKPSYHTISTESNHLSKEISHQNPYQPDSKNLQSTLHHPNINPNAVSSKDSKKKLKAFVRNSEIAHQSKTFKPKRKVKVGINDTPSSDTPSAGDTHHGMMVSHSVKNQVTLKNELSNVSHIQSLELQIQKLNEKVLKLEKDNKILSQENLALKADKLKENAIIERRGAETDYTPHCAKMHQRDDSRSSTNYNLSNFTQQKNVADFTRSYSFENSTNSRVLRSSDVEPNFTMSYKNYAQNNDIAGNKENLVTNIALEKARSGQRKDGESLLMRKVTRILEKRDLNKKSSKYTPREGSGPDYQKICKSLKHTKNQIIARINNKYGKRME